MATVFNRAATGKLRSQPIFLPSVVAVLFALAALPGLKGVVVAYENGECLDCHADSELVRETDYRPGTSVYVDDLALEASIHEGMDCVDCHPDAEDDHPERLAPADCADCHEDENDAYIGSLHGLAHADGEADAPTCADCHGSHQILAATDTASLIHPSRLPYTCGQCHADPDFIARRPISLASPLVGYEQSVHFHEQGATCADCHSSHTLRKSSDPQSKIYPGNIATTCGRCHEKIQAEYEQSVHGRVVGLHDFDAPTCVDCHGEHEIRTADDPLSSVYPTHIVNSTCAQCHENLLITNRHGLARGRFVSYKDTYHGLAVDAGSIVTAHCASCHGIHNILPSTDPASLIHPDNLQTTCGECHPSAGVRFVEIPVHEGTGTSAPVHPLDTWVRRIYITLIFTVVGAMLAHNGVVILHAVREKYRRTRAGPTYVRLNSFQIAQHTTMVISFTALVITGFALKFPDAWWVQALSWTGMEEMSRRIVHRIAGVVMLSQSIIYLGYLCATRAGRVELRALAPSWQDGRDLVLNLRHFLGRTPDKPSFDRYNYIEKSEFWALAWGVAIMGITGLVLWLPEWATRIFPAWMVHVSEIVHYYEAWLATLAILVWHLFYVIFYPGEYPLNLTCLDGRIAADELRTHHPREYERLHANEDEEKNGNEKHGV